jgi:nicotinate-nucleotide--dimethylbenzimidazole phosphoribosyltransferase
MAGIMSDFSQLFSIAAVDNRLTERLKDKLNQLAKPPGSLGRVEEVAIRIGLMQNTLTPRADKALLMVFAGDHGLNAENVSPYPSAVTVAMVKTFLAGRATANAFARGVSADMCVVDAGIAEDLPDHKDLIKASVRRGSRNALHEAALTANEVTQALKVGADLARNVASKGYDILALGEMGIGNSASAALVMHRLTGLPIEKCVGRGAGHDDKGLAHKLQVLTRVASRSSAREPIEVLSEFGGCEIAMIAGAVLGAASQRRIIMVDGFICTAAALAAIRINPIATAYCLFSHQSAEGGHRMMLEALGVEALLNLDMRLGEGTGALLAIPLVRSAARLLSDVAPLSDVLQGNI